jgi:hypothetical protein
MDEQPAYNRNTTEIQRKCNRTTTDPHQNSTLTAGGQHAPCALAVTPGFSDRWLAIEQADRETVWPEGDKFRTLEGLGRR